MWVPQLRLERRMFLHPKMNPFFERAEVQLFLARRGGQVVGRISAHIDRRFNETQNNEWGWFGFLDFEDDPEVLKALLDTAAAWHTERGRERMVGPADFAMNDECGILIEGFDREPMLLQPWHPPYYMERCEEAGLTKAMDLYMWHLQIEGRENVMPLIWEMADAVEPKHGIVVRRMSRRSLKQDMHTFGEIFNEAWSKNWGFVPYSDKELDNYAQEIQLVFDKDWMLVAERKDTGEPVGVAMTFPDINQVLKKMNGRILPFGWWYFLTRRKRMDRVRVGFLGVKPEYQHTGVAARLYQWHFDMAEVTNRTWGEMGWILETNRAMNRGMEAMGGTIVKRYRMYERVLSEG